MQISLLLMEEIIKLFVIMFMGYTVVKAGLMKSSESKSVSVIMVYLVIPCVILNAFQVEYTPDVQKGLLLACAAAVVSTYPVSAPHRNPEKTTPFRRDRTRNDHLFKRRNPRNPAGTGITWSGIRHLLQCLH